MNKTVHKGQVALVLILIMSVVSALAVSLASRSTVDTRIQQSESEGVQALINAQTGLEQMIINPAGSIVENSYEATKSSTGTESVDAGRMETGSTLEINLASADFGHLTGLNVYWGPDNGNPSDQPAIFVSIMEGSGKITDYAYDYNGTNGFTAAANGSGGYAKSSGVISLNSNVVKARISVLGAPALLKVVPVGAGAIFPSQINRIKSVGSVDSIDKVVKYGLQYDESMTPNVPSVFDYALFSGGTIIQ